MKLPIAVAAVLMIAATESRVPVDRASLWAREVGRGPAVIVLHGGPDFDSSYLLPDLDLLADSYRLIYYDQRGRGRSTENVKPEDVTLASDLDDIDRVAQHFHARKPALLGHSWGTVLALEYALRRPDRVSGLILMNPAPASAADVALLRKSYLAALGVDMDRQRAIVNGDAYKSGDPAAVVARYRIHFEHALKRPEDYDRLMARMKPAFERQGAAGIVKARAVEDRLYVHTWQVPGYDLMPKLRAVRIPTLVLTGDSDFIPLEVSQHIASAIPGAKLVVIKDCGHFSYMERPDEVHAALAAFKTSPPPAPSPEGSRGTSSTTPSRSSR